MRFSVWPSATRPFEEILAVVKACDEAGWDGAYIADHFMPFDPEGRPQDGPVLECLTVVSALAASTTHLRLGTLVCGNLYRHPAVLANAVATIDNVSGGRFVLGLGAGWQANEHAAFGIDLPPLGQRLDQMAEAAEVVTGLLRQRRTNFSGRFYEITDAPCEPKPVGHLPLLIGGSGEQRTMRIAARLADEWNSWCSPEVFRHKSAVLDSRCEEIGRDPSEIARSSQVMITFTSGAPADGPPARMPSFSGTAAQIVDLVGEFADAGLDELIVPDWSMGPAGQTNDTLALFLDEVASHFR